MQSDRLKRIGDLWTRLVATCGDTLTTPAAVQALAALRLEYQGVEADARALGFGRGFELGQKTGHRSGFDAGVADGRAFEELDQELSEGKARPH